MYFSSFDTLANNQNDNFTSADSDVRLARRIQRDTVERGRNIQDVLDQVTLKSF